MSEIISEIRTPGSLSDVFQLTSSLTIEVLFKNLDNLSIGPMREQWKSTLKL